jgi:hypothetical protein
VDDAARTAALVEALDSATAFDSFTTTLEQVAAFHPRPVIDALWRGLETRQGDVAMHYAGMLAFLHGKAESSFDWSLRPLLSSSRPRTPRRVVPPCRSFVRSSASGRRSSSDSRAT